MASQAVVEAPSPAHVEVELRQRPAGKADFDAVTIADAEKEDQEPENSLTEDIYSGTVKLALAMRFEVRATRWCRLRRDAWRRVRVAAGAAFGGRGGRCVILRWRRKDFDPMPVCPRSQ